MQWQFYALFSAIFAALVSVWAKIGLDGVDSNLATAIRTVVILLFAWAIVFVQGTYKQIPTISPRAAWFLVFSGLATGVSWLCYFRALQLGQASQVAPFDKLSAAFTVGLAVLFLGETLSWRVAAGAGLIVLGSLLLIKK